MIYWVHCPACNRGYKHDRIRKTLAYTCPYCQNDFSFETEEDVN